MLPEAAWDVYVRTKDPADFPEVGAVHFLPDNFKLDSHSLKSIPNNSVIFFGKNCLQLPLGSVGRPPGSLGGRLTLVVTKVLRSFIPPV